MSFELTGKLHKIFETEQKTQSFSAREFVVYTDQEQYPQYIKFQLTQDRCSAIDAFKEGAMVKVHFDLRGREWQGKYFTNLNAWRLENAGTPQSEASKAVSDTVSSNAPFPTEEDAPAQAEGESFDDDLPF